MTNQKELSVARFSGMRWKKEGDVFKAQAEVRRGVFGYFYVEFKSRMNGETLVSIKNWQFADFGKEETAYKDFESAVGGISEFFKEIDELLRKLPKAVIGRAEMAYSGIIMQEIQKQRR